ncbi:hypothetical protein C8T65DRAFT_639838 [Cerioporus squamosus]|nr:hypothetical protein C8T65DRAFT_639838 [Cerioporus squamosus]
MGSRLVDAGLDPSDVVDVKGIATILRTDICHVCNARSGDGKKLQKCAGCNIAVYCGRECQKAAWKAHRYEHLIAMPILG